MTLTLLLVAILARNEAADLDVAGALLVMARSAASQWAAVGSAPVRR